MANNMIENGKPSPAAVSARAFELWERDGRQQGRDVDYWLQAEAELTLKTRANSPSNQNGTESAAYTTRQNDEQSKGARRAPKKKEQPVLA
jgi:hypothetical protein